MGGTWSPPGSSCEHRMEESLKTRWRVRRPLAGTGRVAGARPRGNGAQQGQEGLEATPHVDSPLPPAPARRLPAAPQQFDSTERIR